MDPRLDERYIVIKLEHLTPYVRHNLKHFLWEYDISTVDCVVVEEDWPEYGPTIDAIMERQNNED